MRVKLSLSASVSQNQTYYLLLHGYMARVDPQRSLYSRTRVPSKAWNRFSGWITMLAGVIVVSLSLSEGNYFLDVVQAISNGHQAAALTNFDLSFVFLHSFFIAPSLLLPLAFVLRSTSLLPRYFWGWALIIGIAFESIGLPGLFIAQRGIVVILILSSKRYGSLAAAVMLAVRNTKVSNRIPPKMKKQIKSSFLTPEIDYFWQTLFSLFS